MHDVLNARQFFEISSRDLLQTLPHGLMPDNAMRASCLKCRPRWRE